MSKVIEFYNLNRKKILVLSLILVIIIIGFISFYFINQKYNKPKVVIKNEEIPKNIKLEKKEEDETLEIHKITIDIKGEVLNPGVYELLEGSRVMDAIKEAGGLTENAYTRYLNLSKKLEDENVIIVNNISEIEKIKESKNKEIVIETSNTVSIEESKIITNEYKPVESSNKEEGKNDKNDKNVNAFVNINEASLEELMTLDGIGEKTAKSIIQYRETNGNFKSIEELLNIDGIGESKYAKIKESITVK